MPLSTQSSYPLPEDREPGSDKSRRKLKQHRARSRGDALSRRVRRYRKKCEKRSASLENVERYVLVTAGTVGFTLVIFLSVSLLAEIECAVCIEVLIAIAALSLIIWSYFKLRVLLAEAVYKRYRKKQKSKFRSKKTG